MPHARHGPPACPNHRVASYFVPSLRGPSRSVKALNIARVIRGINETRPRAYESMEGENAARRFEGLNKYMITLVRTVPNHPLDS